MIMSQYLKCDAPDCDDVVDRLPPDTTLHGQATFNKFGDGAREYAATLGWVSEGGIDLCRGHSGLIGFLRQGSN